MWIRHVIFSRTVVRLNSTFFDFTSIEIKFPQKFINLTQILTIVFCFCGYLFVDWTDYRLFNQFAVVKLMKSLWILKRDWFSKHTLQRFHSIPSLMLLKRWADNSCPQPWLKELSECWVVLWKCCDCGHRPLLHFYTLYFVHTKILTNILFYLRHTQ